MGQTAVEVQLLGPTALVVDGSLALDQSGLSTHGEHALTWGVIAPSSRCGY